MIFDMRIEVLQMWTYFCLRNFGVYAFVSQLFNAKQVMNWRNCSVGVKRGSDPFYSRFFPTKLPILIYF